MKKMILFLLLITLATFTYSCKSKEQENNSKEEESKEYTIHFISEEHEINLNDIVFTDPKTVTLPTPTVRGYSFVKWQIHFGKQLVDANSIETLIKFADDYRINLYAVWEKAFTGYNVIVDHTYTKGEDVTNTKSLFNIMSYKADITMLDFVYNITDTSSFSLSVRDNILYASSNIGLEYKVKTTIGNVVPDLSNLAEISSADGSINIGGNEIIATALKAMLNYKITDKGFSINITANSIANFIQVLNSTSASDVLIDKIADYLANLTPDMISEIKKYFPNQKEAIEDLETAIISGTKDDIKENVKVILNLISEVVKELDLVISLNVNNQEFDGVTIIDLVITTNPEEGVATNRTINFKITDLEFTDFIDIVPNEYEEIGLNALINKIKEGFN